MLLRTPRKLTSLAHLRRRIFTEEYLKIDVFNEKSRKRRRNIPHPEKFKADARRAFERASWPLTASASSSFRSALSGIDVERLIDVANSPRDVDFIASLIVAGMKNAKDDLKYESVSNFFALCFHHDLVATARRVWNDDNFRRLAYSASAYLKLRYLTLLYNGGYYEEVVAIVTRDEASQEERLLAMASLANINTEDAFRRAEYVVERHTAKSGERNRILYAYLAFRLGKHDVAFEVLSMSPGRGMASVHLRVAILLEMGRCEEAMLLIRQTFLVEPVVSLRLCVEIVDKLAEAVRVKYGAQSEMAENLASLCHELDNKVQLDQQSLHDLVFKPIWPPSQSHLAQRPHQ